MKSTKIDAPEVNRYTSDFEVVEANTTEEVVDRLRALFENVKGIQYSYNGYYVFNISVEGEALDCCFYILRNTGPEKKTRGKYSQTAILTGEKPQFVIDMHDITRYFPKLFRYVLDNYSAETIPPFSAGDLNYGLYCPDYDATELVGEDQVE